MLPLVLGLSLGTLAWSGPKDSGSYGDDRMHATDAVPVTKQTLPLLKAAEAGAVVLLSTSVTDQAKGHVSVTGPTLCHNTGLVKPQELALPNNSCSGMLITPTRVLTAAHCLNVAGAKDGFSVILGHHQPLMLSMMKPGGYVVTSNPIRRVKQVLYCKHDSESDVAVLELESAIPATYTPVLPRRSEPVPGEQLHLISSPRGLPIKLSSCTGQAYKCTPATVKRVDNFLFWATVDSHKGSSGGGVTDDNGKLIGVFSGGLLHESGLACASNVRYSDDCPGDVLTRIDKLPLDLFNDKKCFEPVSCQFGAITYPQQCALVDTADTLHDKFLKTQVQPRSVAEPVR